MYVNKVMPYYTVYVSVQPQKIIEWIDSISV